MEVGAKPTTQRRAERTRDRLIDALDALLRERPFPAIAVTDIARRAGVSIGTVYQRFQNQDAAVSILLALYYRRVQDWTGSPRETTVEPRDLRSALELIAENAWRQVAELGYIMRPAYLHSRLRPDLVGPTWSRLERLAQRGYVELLERFDSEIARDDPGQTAGTMAAFINLMALGRLLHPDSAAPFLETRDGFVRDFVDFAYHYLTNRSVARTPVRRARRTR